MRLRCLVAVLVCGLLSSTALAQSAPRLEKGDDGRYMLVDTRSGRTIVDGIDRATRLADGVVLLARAGKQGRLAADGALIPPVYDEITSTPSGNYVVARDGRYGVLDHQGHERLAPRYDDIDVPWREGQPWIISEHGRKGVMDPLSLQVLLPPAYEYIRIDGAFVLASQGNEDPGSRDETHTAFDLRGRPVPGAEKARSLAVWNDTLLVVDQQRVVAADGREVVAAGRYDRITPHAERAIVTIDGKAGVIDTDGHEVMAPTWGHLEPLSEGYQGWMRGWPDAGRRVGVIDADGRVIVAPRWDGIELEGTTYRDGERDAARAFFRAIDGKHTVVLDLRGKPVFAEPLDGLYGHGGDLYQIRRNGLTGLCDDLVRGHCPIPVEYPRLEKMDGVSGLWVAQRDGRLGLLGRDGKVVVPLEYDFVQAEPDVHLEGRPTVIAARKGLRTFRLLLEADARGWTLRQRQDLRHRPIAHDAHPQAVDDEAVVRMRWLPEGYTEPQQVERAAAKGTLRALRWPSLLLSERHAYLPVDLFAAAKDWPSRVALCGERDGFSVPRPVPGDATPGCGDEDRLQFRVEGDVAVCDACAALGLPTRWRRSEQPLTQDCPAPPAFDQHRAQRDFAALVQRWEAGLPQIADAVFGSPWPALSDAVANNSRAQSFIFGLFQKPFSLLPASMRINGEPVDDAQAAQLSIRFLELLQQATPVASGGIYPETLRDFSGLCAEVWYLRVETFEQGFPENVMPSGRYTLPDEGKFERDVYPFVTVVRDRRDGSLRLAGVSAEMMEVLRWWLEVQAPVADTAEADAE